MNDGSYILALGTVLFTLFVVLVERKVLAYAMRRVGPILMGRNGAFQIAFDLVKLVTKETFLIPRPTTSLAPMFLALTYCCQLMFSQTFI
jgi:NADH:ubiquinone oxidoreductase subunit H